MIMGTRQKKSKTYRDPIWVLPLDFSGITKTLI